MNTHDPRDVRARFLAAVERVPSDADGAARLCASPFGRVHDMPNSSYRDCVRFRVEFRVYMWSGPRIAEMSAYSRGRVPAELRRHECEH